MFARAFMDFDGEQNSVPGRVPDFGAIFMSNSATRRECFRRKLFGLPSSQAYFVKQVKAGMVLFLFEFERRELYGVFQACSDGAMNIVPHAYSSSGKKFPAQVKFTTIWYCSPLSEHEFCDAIKDNYFSANKFNFGLSQVQVHRLLLLFSSRKLKDELPQRQLTRSRVTKLIGNSLGKVRRVVDDDKFELSDRVEIEHDVDNDLGPVISTEYRGNSLGKEERVHNDGRFATSDRVGNKRNVGNDLGFVFSTEYPGNSLGKGRRVSDDGRFATSDRVENERNVDNGLGPVILTEYPGLYQSNLNPSVYSSKPILETNNSLVQDQLMPSAVPRSMEPQISNLSYSTSHGDANVLSPLPYDPNAPSIQYEGSSSFGVNHSSNSVKECAPPYNSSGGNIFSSSRNESFQFHVEPKGISKHPDVTSGIGNYVPPPTPNYCECSYCMTSIPFSRAGYSENRVVDSADFEGHNDLSFSKISLAPMPISRIGNHGRENMGQISLAPMPISRIGNHGRENMGPSAYSFSPSKNPFFVSDYGYPVVTQDKYEHKTPRRESNEALIANVPLSNRNQRHLQGGVCSFESRSVYSHEHNSFNCDSNSGLQKKRNSVFSRLTLVPEVYEQENDTRVGYDEYDMDTSTDEVMDMLHQGHFHWVKEMSKSKLSIRRYDDVEKFRNKNQTTFYSQTAGDHSLMIPKEMNMDGTPDNEESGNAMAERTLLVDFKRRSEVRKIKDETKTGECFGSIESDGLLSMPRKRRKLVRPNFSNNESSCDKGVNGDSSPNLLGSSQESYISKDIIGSHENEKKLSQYVGLQHVMCQIGCEGNNTDVDGGSNCKGERKTENYGASFRSGGEGGKELAQNVGTENALVSDASKDKSHNAEEGSSIKDSVVDGLSQDYNNTSGSNVQESSPGICEGEPQNGMTFVGIDRGRSDEKLFQIVENANEVCPISCEIAIGKTKNSSSNQNLKSEKVLEEPVDIYINGEGKGNKQQLSLGSGTGRAKASFETVSCNMQESSREIIDLNVDSCGEVLVTTSVENLNEVLPSYHESTIGKSKTIPSDQNSKPPQEVYNISVSGEGKGNEQQLSF